jgi:Flp pilus assembly protein TadD/glycosyltransferase involved in cell wall biosynthesis
MDVQRASDLKTKISESPDDYTSYLELANIYVKAERYRDAYDYLTTLVGKMPQSVDVLSTTGAVAARLEEYDEALEYLNRAAALSPEDKNIFHNIGLLHAARQELSEAEFAFRRLVEIDPCDAKGYNDLAVVLAHQNKPEEAKAAFEKAILYDPDFEKAYENFAEFCLEEKLYKDGVAAIESYLERAHETPRLLRWRRTFKDLLETQDEQVQEDSSAETTSVSEYTPRGLKIAFFASQDSFAEPILKHLSTCNEIKRFAGDSTRQIEELMQWADIAWFVWCDQLLIEATKLRKTCKIICRLHSYEAFTNMPANVNWSKVDKLILVNQNVAQVLDRLHDIHVDREIIHNGVDLKRFTVPDDKVYGKKVCSLGYINYKKNPGLLLYCFKAIHNWDPEFEFYIAGQHQDPRIEIYMDHMLKRLDIPVYLENWIDNVPAYLKNKDFVISTSLFESFHYSLAEGMASGVLPLVHAWPGSENIYPPEYLFDTPEDCVKLLMRLMESDRKKLADKNREYIETNYSLDKTVRGFNRVIEAVCPSAVSVRAQ